MLLQLDNHLSLTSSKKDTSIADSIFYICLSLKQITIPSSVITIGQSSFKECTSLVQVTFEIPSSVTSIGDHAFAGCSKLREIEIPSSVTLFGDYAFSNVHYY